MAILTKVNLAGGADVAGADNLFQAFTKVNQNIDESILFYNAEVALDGTLVYPYVLPQTYTYVGTTTKIQNMSCAQGLVTWTQTPTYDPTTGDITSITCTDGTNTWVKTVTFDASNRMIHESAWVLQA